LEKLETSINKQKHVWLLSHPSLSVEREHPNVIVKPIKAWDGKVYAIRTAEGGKFKLSDEFIQELSLLA